MKIRKLYILLLVLVVCAIPFRGKVLRIVVGGVQTMKGRKTVPDRIAQYGDAVQGRMASAFGQAGVAFPPATMTLVAIKDQRVLQLWVSSEADGGWKHLKDYPILGMSGTLGPKLKQGDRQVPEGLYRVESLNPNSLYHLALRVNYPSDEDRQRGKEDGRTDLGSDIMIHGKSSSIGCLAMGDEAAEELFVLAAETGIDHISVILTPVDFRIHDLPKDMPTVPGWMQQRYDTIRRELNNLGK